MPEVQQSVVGYSKGRNPTGYVYFIQCGEGGPIKIGYSKHHMENRIKIMQIGCPHELKVVGVMEDSMRKLEKELHKRFKRWRIRGEWFEACQEITEFLGIKSDAKVANQHRDERDDESKSFEASSTTYRVVTPFLPAESFGVRLKQLRQEAAMTQVDLSEASGVPRQTIAVMETGRRDNPTLDLLIKLADGLGCKLDDLRPATVAQEN